MRISRSEWELIVAGVAYFLINGVNTMPSKRPVDFYQWFYDWAHLMLSSPMAQQFERRMHIEPNGTSTTDTIKTSTPAQETK